MFARSRQARLFSSASCIATFTVVNLIGSGPSAAAGGTTTKVSRSTSKTTSQPSSRSVGVASTVAKVSAGKTQVAKAPKVIQPGKDFVGWGRRSGADWPADESAVVLEPINKTILVRQTPDFSTPGILLGSGTSVSGSLGLLVVGEADGWWKVLLPVRPNGTVGWVQSSTANARLVRERIVVDLATNTLQLMVDGKVTQTEVVATGTSGTPTPDGLFFVKSIVPQANPAGGRGPFVLVLSAFSNVLNSFDGGQGAVGIHGTSAPGKLGQDVSHGCIRTRNDTIIYFAKNLRPGTPVEIRASAKQAPTQRWATPSVVASAPDGLLAPTRAAQTSAPPIPGGVTTTTRPTPATSTTIPDSSAVESARPPVTGL